MCLFENYSYNVSTRDNTPIDELAQLADKILEVAIPTMSKVSVQSSPNYFEVLQGEIVSLKQEIKTLQQAKYHVIVYLAHTTTHQAQALIPHQQCAGISKSLKLQQRNANHPVLTQEMTRPDTDGDRYAWPSPLSPFYVTNRTSGLHFLVDTGAEVTIIHLQLLTITTTRITLISRLSIIP